MGRTLIIYVVILAVLALGNVAAADESMRFPFPAKAEAAEPDKSVKFPFPSRSDGVVKKNTRRKGVYLAEEPAANTRSSRSGSSRKKPRDSEPGTQITTSTVTETETVSGKAMNSGSEPKATSGDMMLLRDHIQRLEDKILKMEEENEIRRQLEITEAEKDEKEDVILSAAGRDYTLMKPGRLGFEYSLRYAGDASDSVSTTDDVVSVKHNASHTLTNSFVIEYPVKDNFTVNTSIPFVYKYSSQTSETAKDTSDLGDVRMGFQFQPVKAGKDLPSFIVSGSLTCPTGRSPYKIDSAREMSTGNGLYSVGLGCHMSKAIDPLVAFGGFNVEHGFDVTGLNYKTGTQGESGIYLAGVEPGDIYSLSMGIGYSLSYKATLTMSYQYSYQSPTTYDWEGVGDSTSEGSISSVFSVGTGWNVSPKRSVNVRLGIGLTNNDSDFSLQVRIPFTYVL